MGDVSHQLGGALPLPPPPPLAPVQPQAIPPSHLPPLLTLTRNAFGWSSIEGTTLISAKGYRAPFLKAAHIEHAFGADQPDDRHFTCYAFRNRATSEDEWDGVRMTQSGYALMRDVQQRPGQFPEAIEAMCQNMEVVGNLLAIDYDLPDHGAWTPELIEQHQAMLVQAGLHNPLLASPSIAYMTRGGFRLVWILATPVPIEGRRGLVDLLPGLVAACHVAGLHVDPSCKDWTRIFRLPRVMREGTENGKPVLRPTSQESYLRQSWGCVNFTLQDAVPPDGNVLVWPPEAFKGISEFAAQNLHSRTELHRFVAQYRHLIGQVPQMGSRASTVAIGDQPDDAQVGQLMGGGGVETMIEVTQVHEWLKHAVKVTTKRPEPSACASAAFNYLIAEKPLIDTLHPNAPGQLHAGITAATMAVMRTLRAHLRHESARPQVIHAMILQAARRANKMRANPRPDAELSGEVWSIVSWAFRTEMGVLEDEEEQEQSEREAETLAAQVQTHNTSAQQQLLMQAVGRMIQKDPTVDPLNPPSPEQYEWMRANWMSFLVMVLPKIGRSVLRMFPGGRIGYDMPVDGFGELLTRIRDCGHGMITTTSEGAKPGKLVCRPEHEILGDYGTVAHHFNLSRLIPHNEASINLVAGNPEVTFTMALPGMDMNITPRFDPDIHEWLTGLGGDRHEELFDWLAAAWDLSRPATMLHIEGRTDSGKSLIIKGLKNCTATRQTANISDMFSDFQDQALRSPILVADEEHAAMGRMTRSAVNVLKKLATGEANVINAKGKAAVQIAGFWRVIMVENGTRMLHFSEDMNASDKAALLNRLLCVKADGDRCRAVIDRVGGRAGVETWLAYKLPQHLRYLAATRKLNTQERVLASSKSHQAETSLMLGTNTMSKLVSALGVMLTDPSRWRSTYELKGNYMLVAKNTLTTVMMELAKTNGTQMPAPQSLMEALKTLTGAEAGKAFKVGKNKTEWLWMMPLGEVIQRMAVQGEQLDIKAGIGIDRWTTLVPEAIRAEYDQAEALIIGRAPVSDSASGSKSLGDSMRAASAATEALRGMPGAPPGPTLPAPPSAIAMGPAGLFGAAGLPPAPPGP